jgi:predicted nicotinamide N-methyase
MGYLAMRGNDVSSFQQEIAPEWSNDPQWAALKADIERTVSLVPTTIQLVDRQFVWYSVTDPEQLLEAAVDSQLPPEEVDPFWAATWRAAQGLDRFLQRWDLSRMRVLELGCGSGQAGFAAAVRGAEVIMSDAVPIAMEVARLNAWLVRDQVTFAKLNWKSPDLRAEPFPLIIGSDLVYDPNLFPLLDRCSRMYLQPQGTLLLSEPHRHTGDFFSEWIRKAGWTVIEHDIDMQDGRVPIRIFECSLS